MTRHRRSGFTLIEMVVALAVLSLVMLATVTGLRTLATTQGSLERVTMRNDEIRSISAFLRDALELAVVGDDTGGLSLGGGGADLTVFEASPGSLVWTTVMRFGENAGGRYVVRVAREGSNLVMRWQQGDAGGTLRDWNNVPSRTLISDVQRFEVAYRRQPGGDWQERWDDAGVPRWVRLRVQAAERYWPDIVMDVPR